MPDWLTNLWANLNWWDVLLGVGIFLITFIGSLRW